MSVYPISFSIPESKIITNPIEKTRIFAHIVPGDLSTYIYSDEASYYKGYQESVFGRTSKKGGWDCLRHYEILANGCIPYFENLAECPANTLFRFPKDLVLEAMKSTTPETYIPQLLDYTRKNLTCRAMAQYVLDTVGCPNPTRVLFLSTDPRPDYLRCLTLIGMKEILGNRCVDLVHVPHIYDDYPTPSSLYGKGMTYSRIIPSSAKASTQDLTGFDLVIYGSMHRGLPHWDDITKLYTPNQIVLLCGEDIDHGKTLHNCSGTKLAEKGFNVFIRELTNVQPI